ncbi:MAG: hypothetical protein EHM77_01700, partial [Planctomycetaceae bacterium]
MTHRYWLLIILVLTSLLPQGSGQSSSVLAADQWTNLTGTSSVSGELLGIWNGRVLLKLEGRRRVSVKM